jgi:hypothetical protein
VDGALRYEDHSRGGGEGEVEPARYLLDLTNRRGPTGFSGFCMSDLSGPENRAAVTRFVMYRMSDRRGRALGQTRIEHPTEPLRIRRRRVARLTSGKSAVRARHRPSIGNSLEIVGCVLSASGDIGITGPAMIMSVRLTERFSAAAEWVTPSRPRFLAATASGESPASQLPSGVAIRCRSAKDTPRVAVRLD